MAQVIEGTLDASGQRLAIVVSRWNDLITRRLLDGALDCIRMHGGDDSNVTIVWCPGAFEIPLVVARAGDAEVAGALLKDFFRARR